MDMREQLYMLEIEKHRGIKDAAQALHISPPALSIFLGNLEERTGTRFFDRIGKQFVPTEAGKIYLEHAKEMIKIEAHYENLSAVEKNIADFFISNEEDMDFSSRHILFPPQSFPSDVPALYDIFPHFPSEQKKVLFVFPKAVFSLP